MGLGAGLQKEQPMTRILKALAMAALATLAMGAMAAAAAQAHTPAAFNSELEETVITSTVDGATGKEKHHVIDLAGKPLTCPEPSFKGELKGKINTELTLEPEYNTGICSYNTTENAAVTMNGGDYVFRANGEFVIGSKAGKNCATEPIKIQTENFCLFEIGPQTIKGVLTYKNIVVGGVEEITVEIRPTGIAYTAGAFCPAKGIFANGNYTTGNTILTGANKGGAMTNIKWTATVP